MRKRSGYSKPFRTKPGKHGTLYLYEFVIQDTDPGAGQQKLRYWGYSEDDAYEKLIDNLDFQGWTYRSDYKIVGEPHRVHE